MKITEKLEGILFAILSVFQFLLAFTIFVAVMARYVFKFPIPEINIVQNFSLIWLVMLGAGYAIKTKKHLDIDLFGAYISEKANRIRTLIIDIIILLAVIFILVVGYKTFLTGFVRTELTPIRFLDHRISLVYFNSAMFFGAIVMVVYQIINVIKSIKDVKSHKKSSGGDE